VLNHCRRSHRLYDHEYRHNTSVCQLPAVASRGRRLARSGSPLFRPPFEQLQNNWPQPSKIPQFVKPPSSALVKPPSRHHPGQERRRAAGSRDIPHTSASCSRPRCSASSPTDYLLDACPGCGGHLLVTDAEPPIVVQQVDIRDVPWRSTSTAVIRLGAPTVARRITPRSRSRSSAAAWPGPRLTTVIAYLKGGLSTPRSRPSASSSAM